MTILLRIRSSLLPLATLAALMLSVAPHCRAAAKESATSTDTDIYSNDDLILVNPIQSSAVLLCIIAASTLVELALGRFSRVRNRYARVVYRAGREELTVIGFGVMSLQFVVNSFPSVSTNWRIVVEWVAVCLVYMGILYVILAAVVVFSLKLRSKAWRTFEWARIDADSHHGLSEQVFKLARRYFVTEIARRLSETGSELVSIPPVAFSSFCSLLECGNMKELLSFSIKTWLVVGVLIFVNATRSMTIASLDEDATLVTAHIVSFILILGYLVLALHAGLVLFLQHRVRAFTVSQLDPATHDSEADAPRRCLLFGSERHTLEVAKALLLSAMWYTCVFAMCFAYMAWDEYGAVALLVYVAAAAPPVLMVASTPFMINLVTFCSAMSVARRDEAIAHLAGGGIVFEDVSSDSGSDEDGGSLDSRVKMPKGGHRPARSRRGRGGAAEGGADGDFDGELSSLGTRGRRGERAAASVGFRSAADYDDTEYNGPPVTLNGADGGLLEETNRQAEEKALADRARYNHFGYEREREEDEGLPMDTFRESRIHFRD